MADTEGPPPYLYEDAARVHPENDDWAEEDYDNLDTTLVCDFCYKVFNEGYQDDVTGNVYCTQKCVKAAGINPQHIFRTENDL